MYRTRAKQLFSASARSGEMFRYTFLKGVVVLYQRNPFILYLTCSNSSVWIFWKPIKYIYAIEKDYIDTKLFFKVIKAGYTFVSPVNKAGEVLKNHTKTLGKEAEFIAEIITCKFFRSGKKTLEFLFLFMLFFSVDFFLTIKKNTRILGNFAEKVNEEIDYRILAKSN